jgi:hypothetical protein
MANCGGSGQRLRELLINIVEHYKDNHAGCHHTSYCKRPNYTANKDILTDPQAIDAFSKKIKSLAIYRHADSYARCRDTFWVESFNHALLSYLPKRIHFGDAAYHMRMDIAVMDWVSCCLYIDLKCQLLMDMSLYTRMRMSTERSPAKNRWLMSVVQTAAPLLNVAKQRQTIFVGKFGRGGCIKLVVWQATQLQKNLSNSECQNVRQSPEHVPHLILFSMYSGDVREDHPFIDVFHAEPLVYDDGDSDHFED